MRIEELDFDVPRGLIAQSPAEPRDSCRLMHLDARGGRHHLAFTDLQDVLVPGDLLVFNDSRVLPARVFARKPTGGAVELLFLHAADAGAEAGRDTWEALARPSGRLRVSGELLLPGGEALTLVQALGEGRWLVSGPDGVPLPALMQMHGILPLPPYIAEEPSDPSTYQTVYASESGSTAAPTAGLHFTPALLEGLAGKGVESAHVTLHVGLDTFLPIREEEVERHAIHSERYHVRSHEIEKIREAHTSGRRIVAVGTTATRVLETLGRDGALRETGASDDLSGCTDIFITPGHHFEAVDVLITNFHLPRSSVLALTLAFAGAARLREAYADAVASGYRFFSLGDAMVIERLCEERDGGRTDTVPGGNPHAGS